MLRDLISILREHRKALAFLGATWGVYFIAYFSRIVHWDADGFWAGHVNVWSDWNMHIGMVHIFAYKSPSDWFAYHPFYSHGRFTYPFLTNLISGLLVRAGVPLVPALTIPSITYTLLLISGQYLLFYTLFKSRRKAVLAIFIFLLSSGPGFLRYLWALIQDFSWEHLFFPVPDYSRIDDRQWYGGNVTEALLGPQRAFLLGMTISSWGLFAFFRGRELMGISSRMARRYWLLAGTLFGILAFTHVHSLIVVTPGLAAVVLYGLYRRTIGWKDLPFVAVPAVVLVSGYYFGFLRGGIENPNFQSWHPAYTADGKWGEWVWLWLRIWGLSVPFAIWSWVVFARKQGRVEQKLFFGSFFGMFALGNLILFQPVAWDNSKVFFWCYLMFSALMASYLVDLHARSGRWPKRIAVALLIGITATGMLESYRLQLISRNRFQMTYIDNIRLAEKIRAETGPRDVFLTAPEHNQFLMMWAARPILLGFTPWVWNFGFRAEQTEADLKEMYLAGPRLKELLAKHDIHYVLIGMAELQSYKANETEFARLFPVAFFNGGHRVYDVKRPL